MYIIMIMLFIQGADDTALLLRDFEGEIWSALRKPSIQVEINWNSTHTPTSFPGLFSAEEREGWRESSGCPYTIEPFHNGFQI